MRPCRPWWHLGSDGWRALHLRFLLAEKGPGSCREWSERGLCRAYSHTQHTVGPWQTGLAFPTPPPPQQPGVSLQSHTGPHSTIQMRPDAACRLRS